MTGTIILKINAIQLRRSFKVGKTESFQAPAPDFGTLQMP